ncbi:MAG: hypothetical protein ACI9KS_000078 [Sulfitobacter sp.]|jgi:hypothetical protein
MEITPKDGPAPAQPAPPQKPPVRFDDWAAF